MSLDWSDTGEWLLSGAWDGKAKVWRTETRECVATQGFDGGTVWAARWLPRVVGGAREVCGCGTGGWDWVFEGGEWVGVSGVLNARPPDVNDLRKGNKRFL